jgi:hypothetical protein
LVHLLLLVAVQTLDGLSFGSVHGANKGLAPCSWIGGRGELSLLWYAVAIACGFGEAAVMVTLKY